MRTGDLSMIPTTKSTFRDIQQLLDQGGIANRLQAGRKAAFEIPYTLISDLIKNSEEAGKTLFHTLATTLTIPVTLLCPEASLKIGSLLGIYENSKAHGLRLVWENVHAYSMNLWHTAPSFVRHPNTLLMAKISAALGIAWTIFSSTKPTSSLPCPKEPDTSICAGATTFLASLGTTLSAPVSLATGLTAAFGRSAVLIGLGILIYRVCSANSENPAHGPAHPLLPDPPYVEDRVEVTQERLETVVDSIQAKEPALSKIKRKLARALPSGHNIPQGDQDAAIFVVMSDPAMRRAILLRLNGQIGQNITAGELNRRVQDAYEYYAFGIAFEAKELLYTPRGSSSSVPPVDREMIEITRGLLQSTVDSNEAQQAYKQGTIDSVKQVFIERCGQSLLSPKEEQTGRPDREIVLDRLRKVEGQLLTHNTLVRLVATEYENIGKSRLWELCSQLPTQFQEAPEVTPQRVEASVDSLEVKRGAMPNIRGKLVRGLPSGHNISESDQDAAIFVVMSDPVMRRAILARLDHEQSQNLSTSELKDRVLNAYEYYASGIALEAKEFLYIPRASSSNAPPVDSERIEITEALLQSMVDSEVTKLEYKQVAIASVKQYFAERYGKSSLVDWPQEEDTSRSDREMVLNRLRRVVGQLLTRTTLRKLVIAKYNEIGQVGLWEFWSHMLAPSQPSPDKESQVFTDALADLQSKSSWYSWLLRCPDSSPALRLDINSVVADTQAYEYNRPLLGKLVQLHAISTRTDPETFVSVVNGIVGESGEITEAHIESIRQTINEVFSGSSERDDGVLADEADMERILSESKRNAEAVNEQREAQQAWLNELRAHHGWDVRHAVDDGDCLFASCLDGEGRKPEELRQVVFEHMEGNREAYFEGQKNALMVEVDAIVEEADSHRRESSLSKWPIATRTAMHMLRELRVVGAERAYQTLRTAWLEGTAYDDYVEGMKSSKAYAGTVELQVLCEVLQRPIRVFNWNWQQPQTFVPEGSTRSCDDPDTINIVYDEGRKHFDRFVPRSSGQSSSSSSSGNVDYSEGTSGY